MKVSDNDSKRKRGSGYPRKGGEGKWSKGDGDGQLSVKLNEFSPRD